MMAPGRPASRAMWTALAVASLWMSSLGSFSAAQAAPSAESILEQMRTTYAALQSYSDTGTVLHDYGAGAQDRNTFSTAFNRAPRHFLLDFRKQGGDRVVIWGDPDAFHSWWKSTGQQTEYPNPNNTNAINLNDYPTSGTVTKVPALLYPKAPLAGALTHFTEAALDGLEEISGESCYRLVGSTSDQYGTTHRDVNVRTLTLWIDAKTLLIRQIREEGAAPAGSVNRTTTTFVPRANPTLPDSAFLFKPGAP